MLPWYLILYAGLYVVCLRSLKDYHLCKEPDAEDFQEDEQLLLKAWQDYVVETLKL